MQDWRRVPVQRGEDGNGHQTPTRLRVRFTDPAEFADELRARGPNVEPILRLTFRWTAEPTGLPVCLMSVIASYARRLADGQLVVTELVHQVGEVWHGTNIGASQRTRDRAARARALVEGTARGLGIEVCPGSYLMAVGEPR